MKRQINSAALEIVQGDITALPVDAIVNAANGFLVHGGGVALAISRKGGLKIQQESTALVARHGSVKTGAAAITSGGKLPAKHVIHTVGPVWREHSPQEADSLLRQCVRSSLTLAKENGLKSIAFPAISTGIYGFPIDRAAPLLLQEAVANIAGLEGVMFCLFDDRSYRVFATAFDDLATG